MEWTESEMKRMFDLRELGSTYKEIGFELVETYYYDPLDTGVNHLIIKLARGEKLTGIGIASIFLYIILGLFFVFQIIK